MDSSLIIGATCLGLVVGLFIFYWDTAIGSGSYKIKQKLNRLNGRLPLLGDTLKTFKRSDEFHDGTTGTYQLIVGQQIKVTNNGC